MEILINFGMGILGIITYIVFVSKEQISDPNYTLKMHFQENYKRWAWALSMLALMVVVLKLEPAIAESINSILGLNVIDKTGSYFLIGTTLSGYVKGIIKKKST